eukprot:1160534-Pelagomonas_calceolata.AAC.10
MAGLSPEGGVFQRGLQLDEHLAGLQGKSRRDVEHISKNVGDRAQKHAGAAGKREDSYMCKKGGSAGEAEAGREEEAMKVQS